MPPRKTKASTSDAAAASAASGASSVNVNPSMAPAPAPSRIPAPAAKRAKKDSGAGGGAAAPAAAAAPSATADDFEALLTVQRPADPFAACVTLSGNQKTSVHNIRDGMLLCRPARLVVLSAGASNCSVRNQDIHATNPGEGDWSLGTSLIASQCWNADQYTEVRQESMTNIASILRERVGDVICKVEFTKEPVATEMRDLLMRGAELIEQVFQTNAEKMAAYKRLYERTRTGEYRIMRGYILRDADLSTQETETGMVKFLDADLMAEGKYAERQVNLRNIKALTFKGVRYERKG